MASSWNVLASLASIKGDYESARALYERSLAIRRELGDHSGVADSLSNLGLLAADQADYASARALYEESLAIRRQLGDKKGIATSLTNMGLVMYGWPTMRPRACTWRRAWPSAESLVTGPAWQLSLPPWLRRDGRRRIFVRTRVACGELGDTPGIGRSTRDR